MVENLAALVRQHYLFADKADDLADAVVEWAHDVAALSADEDRAKELTSRLRQATSDWHFSVVAQPLTAEQEAIRPEDRWKFTMPGPDANFGFRSVGMVDGVATMTITALVPLEWSEATARAAMAFCRHARALIIDLRQCGGGDPDLIALLCSYVLGDQPTALSSVTWRETGEVETLTTSPSDVPFRFDPAVSLFFVVGGWTASGAEALAYDLQALGRATVVGTRTLGAAHRIKSFEIAPGLVATIPSGKVTNPLTGTDWERTGVVPDVLVNEPDDPLEAAASAARGASHE